MASTTTNINVPNLVRNDNVHSDITIYPILSDAPSHHCWINDMVNLVVRSSK